MSSIYYFVNDLVHLQETFDGYRVLQETCRCCKFWWT